MGDDNTESTKFVCPGCGKSLKALPEDSGKRGKCSKCGATVTVPGEGEAVPKAAPPIPAGPASTEPFFHSDLSPEESGRRYDLREVFFSAVENGDTSTVERLLSEEPRLCSVHNGYGQLPLHRATHWEGRERRLGVIKVLLAKGADVNAKDREGDTALHLAANCATDDVGIALLLSRAADVNCRSSCGSTPLHFAAATGSVKAIKALLEAGAKPNATNMLGVNPLHNAAANKTTEVVEAVKALLEAGTDANAVDQEGDTPVTTATRCNHAALPILLAAGARPNTKALALAAGAGSVEVVKLLVAHGAPVNPRRAEDSPLRWAACGSAEWADCLQVAEILLEHGADPTQAIDSARHNNVTPMIELLERHMRRFTK